MGTYGGVPLSQPLPEVVAWVEANISTWDVYEFTRLPNIYVDRRPIKTNSLFWPRGATRWAYAHVFATENQLQQIRTAMGSSASSMTFEMTDPTNENNVSVGMYMLPARPLAQTLGQNGLSLLTLVDRRYYWWDNPTIVEIPDTWAELYSNIGAALGITINADIVSSFYGSPPTNLASEFHFLPLLLDAVAELVGQKICVDYNSGEIFAYNFSSAWSLYQDNLDGMESPTFPTKQAGGFFAFDHTQSTNDLNRIVPESITVYFPQQVGGTGDGDEYSITKSLASLALPEWGSAVGYAGTRAIHYPFYATLTMGNSTPTNLTALQALAEQIAIDWYNWQLAAADVKFTGIASWAAEPLDDSVEWVCRYPGDRAGTATEFSTRIQRPAFNDIRRQVFLDSTAAQSQCNAIQNLTLFTAGSQIGVKLTFCDGTTDTQMVETPCCNEMSSSSGSGGGDIILNCCDNPLPATLYATWEQGQAPTAGYPDLGTFAPASIPLYWNSSDQAYISDEYIAQPPSGVYVLILVLIPCLPCSGQWDQGSLSAGGGGDAQDWIMFNLATFSSSIYTPYQPAQYDVFNCDPVMGTLYNFPLNATNNPTEFTTKQLGWYFWTITE